MKKSMLDKEVKEHDDMFLQSSRAIQSLIDEKNEQIARHLAKVDELKANSNNMQGQLVEGYEHQLSDINRRQENDLHRTENQMNVLSDDISQLVQFRNTYRQNEDQLMAERKRFHNLDLELKRVREEGVRDVEALQKRIQDNFEKQIDEYHKKAQSDAERNISEIERNIQL